MRIFAVVLAPLLLAFALPDGAHGQEAPMPPDYSIVEADTTPKLIVSGQGEVQARPDMATVRLGIENQAESAAAAQESVNQTMQKVLQQIAKLGLPESAIQTAGLSLSPIYAAPKPGQESEPPRVTGYRADNTVQIQVKDLALTGKVIDAALGAGANRLEGVSFALEKDLPYRTRALQMAAQEARTKAKALAEALDLNLTSIRKVEEGPVSVRWPRPMPMFAARAAASPTPVEPGQLKVEATVTLEYEIEPAETKQ